MEEKELIYLKGDLLDFFEKGYFDVIAHGCNCQNVMGAGIAKQIKDRYPVVFIADTVYNKLHNGNGLSYLGQHSCCSVYLPEINKERIIGNLYTQLFPGPNFEYTAFRRALSSFIYSLRNNQELSESERIRIGLPKIGSGLGRGNWKYIEEIIKDILRDDIFEVTIVEYEPSRK